MFTQAECQFLQELVDKHCSNLDNSLTRDSVEQRNKAWETITEEFNNAQVNVITRDIPELKTKYKNMKAQQKTTFKHDVDGSRTITYTVIEAETIPEEAIGEQRRMRTRTSDSNLQNSTPAVNQTRSTKKPSSGSKIFFGTDSDFLDDLNMGSDSEDEVSELYCKNKSCISSNIIFSILSTPAMPSRNMTRKPKPFERKICC